MERGHDEDDEEEDGHPDWNMMLRCTDCFEDHYIDAEGKCTLEVCSNRD